MRHAFSSSSALDCPACRGRDARSWRTALPCLGRVDSRIRRESKSTLDSQLQRLRSGPGCCDKSCCSRCERALVVRDHSWRSLSQMRDVYCANPVVLGPVSACHAPRVCMFLDRKGAQRSCCALAGSRNLQCLRDAVPPTFRAIHM